VRDAHGATLAYLGVSGPSARLDAGRRGALVRPLRAAAERIARLATEQR
jgi:DNA-binding IclR family transcriptional regulator